MRIRRLIYLKKARAGQRRMRSPHNFIYVVYKYLAARTIHRFCSDLTQQKRSRSPENTLDLTLRLLLTESLVIIIRSIATMCQSQGNYWKKSAAMILHPVRQSLKHGTVQGSVSSSAGEQVLEETEACSDFSIRSRNSLTQSEEFEFFASGKSLKASKKNKAVTFGKTELRTFPIIIGDNPSCSSGCPVSFLLKV